MGDIRKMLDPKTIALIGASDKPGSSWQGYTSEPAPRRGEAVFPVNPRKKPFSDITPTPTSQGLRSRSILPLSQPRRPGRLPIVEECGKAGVEGAVVISVRLQGDRGRR